MSIIVKVSDLYERVKELKDDKMQYVHLMILDSTNVDDDVLPPALSFSAIKNKNEKFWVDYDEVDAVEDVEY